MFLAVSVINCIYPIMTIAEYEREIRRIGYSVMLAEI